MAAGAAPEIPDGPFAAVLLCGSKQHQETRYLIARALAAVEEGGILACAAANDAGGKRLLGDLESLGLAAEELSKHKSRVVFARKTGSVDQDTVMAWTRDGGMQKILDGAFVSQPGIFGWDKIDAGSTLLAETIGDHVLCGTGADFGCGYGFLAAHIMQHYKDIKELYCLDADARAVDACRINLKPYGNVACEWVDLTQPQNNLPPLDWVVMNPPFHEGKKAQHSIGADFIKTAATALRPGGDLWMVANTHLPYEAALGTCFRSFETVCEQKGFKVFHAHK